MGCGLVVTSLEPTTLTDFQPITEFNRQSLAVSGRDRYNFSARQAIPARIPARVAG